MSNLQAYKLSASYNEAAESHWKASRDAANTEDWAESKRQAELARKAERSAERFDKVLRHGL